jgi:hypothetical protein
VQVETVVKEQAPPLLSITNAPPTYRNKMSATDILYYIEKNSYPSIVAGRGEWIRSVVGAPDRIRRQVRVCERDDIGVHGGADDAVRSGGLRNGARDKDGEDDGEDDEEGLHAERMWRCRSG